MFNRPILRNEEGASPGGGAPTAAPADPAAQPGTPTQPAAITTETLKSVVAEVMAGMLPSMRDGVFADLRKAGVFKQEKGAAPEPAAASTAAPAPSGLSLADLDARLALERVVASREAKHGLSEAQVRRMRASLSGVESDRIASEADAFLSDLGLVRASAPVNPAPNAQPATPAAPVPPARNASDRGPATAGDVRDVDSIVEATPLQLTSHDIARHNAKHGDVKGREIRSRAINAALMGLKPTRS